MNNLRLFLLALWLGAACAYVWGFTGTAGLAAVTLSEAVFLALAGVMPPLLLLAFLYDETARARLISIAQACLRAVRARRRRKSCASRST